MVGFKIAGHGGSCICSFLRIETIAQTKPHPLFTPPHHFYPCYPDDPTFKQKMNKEDHFPKQVPGLLLRMKAFEGFHHPD